MQIKGILHNSNEGAQGGMKPDNSVVLASRSAPHQCMRGSRKVREAQGAKTSQPEQAVGKQAGEKKVGKRLWELNTS